MHITSVTNPWNRVLPEKLTGPQLVKKLRGGGVKVDIRLVCVIKRGIESIVIYGNIILFARRRYVSQLVGVVANITCVHYTRFSQRNNEI